VRALARRLACGSVLAVSCLVLPPIPVQGQGVGKLAAACGGGTEVILAWCQETALAAQAAQGGLGLAASGGSDMPGSASTLGGDITGRPGTPSPPGVPSAGSPCPLSGGAHPFREGMPRSPFQRPSCPPLRESSTGSRQFPTWGASSPWTSVDRPTWCVSRNTKASGTICSALGSEPDWESSGSPSTFRGCPSRRTVVPGQFRIRKHRRGRSG
jgi:hypothetical protein